MGTIWATIGAAVSRRSSAMLTTMSCRRRRPLLAMGIVAMLAACGAGEPGEVYPMGGSDLRQALLTIDELPPVFGSAALDTSVVNTGDGTITWTASQGFEPVLRFIARTEPVDESHTRVIVQIAAPTGAEGDEIARRLADNPQIRDLYLAAMTEQIDAKLEGREFDLSVISGQLALATAANIGQLSSDLDKVVEEEQR